MSNFSQLHGLICQANVSYLKLSHQYTHPFLCRYNIYSYSSTSYQYHLFHEAFLISELRAIFPSSVFLLFFCPFGIFFKLLSHVQLYATPEMAAHQAPPSLWFSRQEHWSGLPFPSPMHESEKWKWSRSVASDSLRPHGLQPTRLLRPWDFPGKSTGVGCHCLLPLWYRSLHFLLYILIMDIPMWFCNKTVLYQRKEIMFGSFLCSLHPKHLTNCWVNVNSFTQ